ncbi:hypothetical protein EBU71_20900 [bacterium]|nr:hypothetical protein [Candidatus Elulimicrobium humile]
MENLDIIILTSILSTLFVVFGIVVYKEIKTNGFESKGDEKSPRADMIKLVGKLFDQDQDEPVKKIGEK